MKLFVIIILAASTLFAKTNAQQLIPLTKAMEVKDTEPPIDTTDYFPLQNGNYWEFVALTLFGPRYYNLTVIGDTLMPNGKVYKVLYVNHSPSQILYFRKDSNKVFRYYGDSIACINREYKYLDFLLPDSTVWKICRDLIGIGNARGIAETFYDYRYYRFLQKPLETKLFEDIYIYLKDTLWTPSDGSMPMGVAKGIGIIWRFVFGDGNYKLQGAIINGVKFGTFTAVKDELITLPKNFNIQVYPNPFNSTVTLKFILPHSGFTEITICNILGQKVSTILEEYKPSGSYNIKYNADGLSSGIYFVLLKQNQRISSNKIILLK